MTRSPALAAALLPLAAAALVACGSDHGPAVCVSSGAPPMPPAGTRGADLLCRDDRDAAPAWTWVYVAQGTTVPPVGQPLGSSARATPAPSGAAQDDEEEGSAGVQSSGSPSASSEEEDEEQSNSSSISEEEESSGSSSASVSEEE